MSFISDQLQEADESSLEEFTDHQEDLESTVKKLTEKVKSFSSSLKDNLVDTFVMYKPKLSLEELNYKKWKDNIFSGCEKAAKDLKCMKETGAVDEELQKSFDKLMKDWDVLKNICAACEAKKILEKANREFVQYKYTESMVSLLDLINRLRGLTFEPKLEDAVSNIITQAENQYSIYSASVSVDLENIFSWSEKKGFYHLTYSLYIHQCDPIMTQNALKALCATDRLNFELGKFSQFFTEKLLSNVIKHNCVIFTEENIGPYDTIVFNIQIERQDESQPTFQSVFNNLMAILNFLQTTLGSKCDDEKSFIGIFANSIKEKFFTKIIEDCIRNHLPTCDSSYENYKNLVVELESFNKFLIEIHFVNPEESPLDKFIKDTDSILYNKKCDKLLSDIRCLINESQSCGTITVGSQDIHSDDLMLDVTDKKAVWDLSKPLLLPRCVISQNVKSILTLIVQHLVESAELPEYSKKVISYIKSIAVMYQSVVPKKLKVNLECCPLDIALFFNNCFYLAHGLVGPPWKSILPSHIATHLTTVVLGCIQDFRVLGLEKISLYLESQKNAILKNVQPDEPTPWTHETLDQFDRSVKDTLSLMRDLKCSWHDILPSRMYELAFSTLIQALCRAMVQRILACESTVDEHLVYMIAVILQDTAREILELFETPIDLEKKVAIWPRFVKMPVVLTSQLVALSLLWNRSKELSELFTSEEVCQIIKMRFPDDDENRAEILFEIQ